MPTENSAELASHLVAATGFPTFIVGSAMKHSVLLLIGALLLAISGGFFVTYWRRPGGPVINAPSSLHLGTQTIGDTVHVAFDVGNAGDAPLLLTKFHSSCACLTVTALRDGQYAEVAEAKVLPGQRITMRSGFQAQGKSGERLRARLRFATNDPNRSEVIVEFTADLHGPVVAVPDALLLGDLQPGQTVTRQLEVRDLGRKAPFKLHAVRSAAPDLLAVTKTTRSAGDGSKITGLVATYTAELKVTAPTQPGPLHARLDILEEDNPTPLLQVAVSGRVVPRFRLAPDALVFPRRSASGLLYSAKCLCSSTSGQPFALSLRQPPAGLTASLTRQSDSRYLIDVTADPALAKPDAQPHTLTFDADGPAGKGAVSLSVRVVAPD